MMSKITDSSTLLESIKEEDASSRRESLSGTFTSHCQIKRSPPDGRKSHSDDEEGPSLLVLVGLSCQENGQLRDAIQAMNIPSKNSETGLEFIQGSGFDVVFVTNDFESDVFHRLRKAEARIVGPPVIIRCSLNNEPIPYMTRPIYNTCMQGLIVCFTGFRERHEISRMADLVHHMSGSLRRDINYKVTHLVANCTSGEKYRYAVSYHIPTMQDTWIHNLWANRDSIIKANHNSQMDDHYVKPFFKCSLSFYGFSPDEQKHMEELTVKNGGTFVSTGQTTCTHLVIEDHTIKDLPSFKLPSYVVRNEWFWASIQIAACAEESILSFKKCEYDDGRFTPNNVSGSKSRKRKRLKENIAQLVAEGETDGNSHAAKRRSSEFGGVSMSPNSFLDASGTPDKSLQGESGKEKEEKAANKPSARLQVVMELLQTERNYCGILGTLLQTFKEEIEKSPYCDSILKPQEIKIIFGNIPPIYEVHCVIRDDLSEMVANWREDHCVADVFLKQAKTLVKAYPPFVNFYDKTKETIESCEKTNQRFHAFLKVCFLKSECGRQTLPELMIWPVQRLPRIMLLLNDIKKHTTKTFDDHEKLEVAVDALKEVMTHINEGRRTAECQMAMFDIVNDIDNCPAILLSSQRRFIQKIDVVEITGTISGKGHQLTLFLFSDSLEICKRRMRVLNSSTSSPSHRTPRTPHKPAPKAYKHLECISLKNIKRILDVIDSTDNAAIFSLICRDDTSVKDRETAAVKDRLYSFIIDSMDVTKSEVLVTLSKTMAGDKCRTDYENFVSEVQGCNIDIDMAEIGNNTLRKAMKFGKRVSRVFTFNRTPRTMKRAISSLSNAFNSDANMTTPGSEFRDRRMASTMDLSEIYASPFVNMSETANDTVSLGGFSFRDPGDSPVTRSRKSPAIKKLTKYMTLGPSAAKKYLSHD